MGEFLQSTHRCVDPVVTRPKVILVEGWHDLDNSDYDCWPLEKPDEYNMLDCGGLEMAWVQRPPEKAVSGEFFNVTYAVFASDHFYHYAVQNGILSYRVLNLRVLRPGIFLVLLSIEITVVLVHVGVTSLIAHIRVGKMQVALEAKTTVLPAVVCGDGVCEDGEGCSTCPADCGECPLTADARIAIALPICLVCAGFILTIVWFQYQKQKMFWDESWIIDFSRIKQDRLLRTAMGSIISVARAPSDSNASCITALSSCTAAVNSSRKQHFTQTGIYDGRTVAIKKIRKTTFTLSKSIRKEVKQVRFSFAGDIAHGMAYLHQHKIYHGYLKSNNCVIDDRWVCKISDYGLQSYRKEDSCEGASTYQQRLMQIYLAPEAHSLSDYVPTSMADVYRPVLCFTAAQCHSHSSEQENLGPPSTPGSNSDTLCTAAKLIRRCRKTNPTQRPTFEQVKKLLYKMNPNKVSPVDMMMTLMEKYSKHLEVVVAERTQDLMHEKQKTDRLLYSMLPKQVADDLRQGKPSQAQSYVIATIFFSDIVGFTQLSSTSTPYQVVDFLNKLYTTFDEIIDNYDVYKVETIGDAYMVVSGVPKENGIRHASEIASMALDLVAVCKTFRIPHKPNTQLKIRAGIHSGPVVAGVVGTKMPRYCLFGDTVNTASRMESTSEALKIQCSSNTYQLLEHIGEYILVCRGNLQVKGKGDMVTYWLEGKQNTAIQKRAPITTTASQDPDGTTFSLIPGVLPNDHLSSPA
ncbi:Atrial natriuretic peptide receptor 1 [Chelonia mydas]|uniref:Guanylate cyclase n=1 Tax=Chelonia mydas TaxID=8469 RepID=M7B165_CHEMY|nr:Atrial natriuretic peptide receptor 1 [Chelonia mydas]